jgi:hypothetical protein
MLVLALATGCGSDRESQDDVTRRHTAERMMKESQDQVEKLQRLNDALEALNALDRQIVDASAALFNAKSDAARESARAKLEALRNEFEQKKEKLKALMPRLPQEAMPPDPTQRG